jgi:hypothetical protein
MYLSGSLAADTFVEPNLSYCQFACGKVLYGHRPGIEHFFTGIAPASSTLPAAGKP